MFGLDELVSMSQHADLKQEEERLAREKAATAAWLAKAKVPGTYSASQLLEKIANGVEPSTPLPATEPPKVQEKKNVEARFPPPPSSR